MEVLSGNKYSEDEMAGYVYGQNSYFAHVSGLEKKSFGSSNLIKIKYVLAVENAGVNGETWKRDGYQYMRLDGTTLKDGAAGNEVVHNGIWIDPSVPRTDAWKNRVFFEQMSSVMNCPQEDGKFVPFLPELSDIVGKPCIVTFDVVPDKDDPLKSWNRLVKMTKWEGGEVRMPILDAGLSDMLGDDDEPQF